MKVTTPYLLAALVATGTNSIAQSPVAVEGHDAFIKSLREIKRKASKELGGGTPANRVLLVRWFRASKDGLSTSPKQPNQGNSKELM